MKYDPNAYLSKRRNIDRGLERRSKILSEVGLTAKEIAEKSGLSYSSVLYHLKLLEEEKIVRREGKRPFKWRLTGLGQQKLWKYFNEDKGVSR